MKKVIFKAYVMNQQKLMPPSYEENTSGTSGAAGEQSNRGAGPGYSVGTVRRRRDVELSPEDDAEVPGVCVLQEDLYLAEDRGGVGREYSFHMVVRGADPGFSDVERLLREADESGDR